MYQGNYFTNALSPYAPMNRSAETSAYVAAITAAGGSLSGTQTNAVDKFVKKLKNASVYAKLSEVGLFLGGTLASAGVKLKYPVQPLAVLNGFVLGDLTAAGLVGDGSTKWVNTQTSVNDLTADGTMGMGVFLTAECTQPGFGNIIGTDAGGAPQLMLRWNASPNQLEAIVNGFGASSSATTKIRNAIPVGLASAQRVANQLTVYQGGLPQNDINSAFVYSATSGQLGVFSGSGGANKTAFTCGMYYMCNGTVSAADMRILASACNQLMVDLGRVIPDTRNLNYIPIIGQSLAVGSTGTPVISTTQPYKNIAIESTIQGNLGQTTPGYWTNFGFGCQAGGLMPMVELGNETIASGAANTIGFYARADGLGSLQDLLIQNFGLGATDYNGLKKGSVPYQDNIDTSVFTPIPGILYASGPMTVPALFCVHGESDMLSAAYGANIRQWQIDYQTDYQAITGQTGTIPIFHSQPSCWTDPSNVTSATGISPYQILAESKANPTKTLLVCAKYFLPYTAASIHLTAAGYRLLGEYYAKAYYQHVVKKVQWSPLQIINVQRVGAVITLTIGGCVGNLQFDTVNVTDPSGASLTKGFEYTDSAGGGIYARIASVAISLPNQIIVTLSSDPSGNTSKQIGYAYTGTPGNNPGATTGPRGCVKDSDTTVGKSGTQLNNWLVHDLQPVP